MSIRFALPLAALLLAAPALAQDVVRLSPADREATLEAAAVDAPINGAPGGGDGKIHGEMGITVGSNGLRAIYGSTVIPLGQNASLGLAFENVQGGRWRAR